MPVLKKLDNEFLIYEETVLSLLVAIRKADQSKIKKYWKSKDKAKEEQMISGFPFIQTEEQDSLKIDFTSESEFEIVNLKKFD
jgi:hypothetical protein